MILWLSDAKSEDSLLFKRITKPPNEELESRPVIWTKYVWVCKVTAVKTLKQQGVKFHTACKAQGLIILKAAGCTLYQLRWGQLFVLSLDLVWLSTDSTKASSKAQESNLPVKRKKETVKGSVWRSPHGLGVAWWNHPWWWDMNQDIGWSWGWLFQTHAADYQP